MPLAGDLDPARPIRADHVRLLKNETEQRPLVPDRLPCLRNVRINRLRGAEMVIVGLERSGPDVREIDEPQAWWCRVVARA